MPFLRPHQTKNQENSTTNSLRTHLKILHQDGPIRRVSSFISWKPRASVTVEAAFALPFFLFCMIQIMSSMNMIGMQSRFSAALHQTGNQLAFAGYAYGRAMEGALPEEIAMTALTQAYAENQILRYAGREYLDDSCIRNGAAGVSFAGTSIMQKNDMIEIRLSYQVDPVFPVTGFGGFRVEQCYYGRAWTGYDVENGNSGFTKEDPMVYITETGTVYHTDRNCTYLNPSIRSVDAGSIDGYRNRSGGRYYACEICGRRNGGEIVYITEQGSSYHDLLTCSGLKRTIYTIPLSQAEGRRQCSKCG